MDRTTGDKGAKDLEGTSGDKRVKALGRICQK